MENAAFTGSLPEKPKQVKNAVYLLYASVAIAVISLILNFSTIGAGSSVGFAVTVLIITCAVLLLLATMISRGKNWARVAFLILFIAGFPCSMVVSFQMLTTNTLMALIGFVQAAVQLIAIVLLFQKPSSVWFRYKPSEEQKAAEPE